MFMKYLLNHVLEVRFPLINSIQDAKSVFSYLVFLWILEVSRLDRFEQVVKEEDVFAQGISHIEWVVHNVIVV